MDPAKKMEKRMGVYRANVDVYDYVKEPADRGPGLFHKLMNRWFLEYNPLYFFSALCILTGVMLASGARV